MLYLMLVNPKLHDEYYNCSFYKVEDIPLKSRSHLLIGIGYLIMFIILEGSYIPAVIVMKAKGFFGQSCYMIMFYLGIIDIIALVVNALLCGIFSIEGIMYCSSPKLIFFLGCLGYGLWIGQCDAGMILALNRCLAMYNPNYAKALFDGKKIYFWLITPTLHCFLLAFLTRPVIFNGFFASWLFNPHAGYYDDYGVRYVNVLHTINNAAVPIVLISFYGIFLISYRRKIRDITYVQSNDTQKQIFLQAFIICGVTGFTACSAVLPQLFPVPDYMVTLGAFMWTFSHGCPGIIYVVLNRSIRKNIIQCFSSIRSHYSVTPATVNTA